MQRSYSSHQQPPSSALKKKKKTASLLPPEGQSYPPSATTSDRRRSPAVVRAWRTCGHRVAASEMVLRRRQRPAAAAAGGLLGPWLLVAVLVYSSFLGSTVFLAVDAARTSAFVAVAPLPMAPSPSPTAAELVGDSKRKVPTGANPLHNRWQSSSEQQLGRWATQRSVACEKRGTSELSCQGSHAYEEAS